jgi:hypothetical protein
VVVKSVSVSGNKNSHFVFFPIFRVKKAALIPDYSLLLVDEESMSLMRCNVFLSEARNWSELVAV